MGVGGGVPTARDYQQNLGVTPDNCTGRRKEKGGREGEGESLISTAGQGQAAALTSHQADPRTRVHAHTPS